jgi:hypothetical protein
VSFLSEDKVYQAVFMTLIITFTASLTIGLLSLYFVDFRLMMLSFYVMIIGVAPLIFYSIIKRARSYL